MKLRDAETILVLGLRFDSQIGVVGRSFRRHVKPMRMNICGIKTVGPIKVRFAARRIGIYRQLVTELDSQLITRTKLQRRAGGATVVAARPLDAQSRGFADF